MAASPADEPADEPAGPAPAVQGAPAAAPAQAFERLRLQFLAGLPQRWQDISAAASAQQQQAALHRLAGAAGSYGLPALGQLAARAELLSRNGEHPLLPAVLQELHDQIQASCVTLR